MRAKGGSRLGFAAATLALLASASLASAQRPSADSFRPAPTADGVVTLVGAQTPGHLRGSLALYLDYTYDLLTLPTPSAPDPTLIAHRLTAFAVGQLGLGRRGAMIVGIPVVLEQAGGAVGSSAFSIPAHATGDLSVDGRVRVAGALPDEPGQVPLGFGLALSGGATVPTGRQSAFSGEGQITLRGDVLADYYLAPGLGFTAGLGYTFRPYDRVVGGAELDDTLRFAFGARMPLPPRPRLVFRAEVRGEIAFHGAQANVFEVDGGLAYRFDDFDVLAIVGAGFGEGYGAPALRADVGVAWSRRPRDVDGDGVPDEEDACPHLPEDRDGFEDRDGCDDPDNDQDFVLDVDDACPDVAADPERDADMDGCTDPE
jgi:hypothetical protein